MLTAASGRDKRLLSDGLAALGLPTNLAGLSPFELRGLRSVFRSALQSLGGVGDLGPRWNDVAYSYYQELESREQLIDQQLIELSARYAFLVEDDEDRNGL